ncbi:hypothetical protein JCM16777_1393 [Leptotrichia wadei]|uniref:Integral membrane protein n=1 Tax=Leptotrichia wadei TaxID=157687 RepID=A0A7U6QZI3_9FUSO|nr:TMEM175 family protein [Leptotrichia wadei]BBM43143.1 hypothetical protein JCM16777_1393 [Leptotrichia wadei]
MKKERLVAFFDAIIAIVMTVLVLELPKIHGTTLSAIWENRVHYFAYITTFTLFAVFWDTHHTIFDKVEKVTPKIARIQIFLLFLNTLFPYITSWVSENPHSYLVECVYTFFLLGANIVYSWLCDELMKADSKNIKLKNTITTLRRHKIATILQSSSLIIGLFNPMFMLIIGFISLSIWYIPMPKIRKNK